MGLFESFFRALANGIDDDVHHRGRVFGFDTTMYPLHLVGEFPMDYFLERLKSAGVLRTTGPSLASTPIPAWATKDSAALMHAARAVMETDTAGRLCDLWQTHRDVMPWPNCLVGLQLRFPSSRHPKRMVLRVTEGDIGVFIALDNSWALWQAMFSDNLRKIERLDSPVRHVLILGVSALLWTLHCLRHQAVDYHLDESRATRRYNSTPKGKHAAIPQLRVLDLSRTKIERLSVYANPQPPVSTGVQVSPHDRRQHLRRLPSGRVVPVKACQIHGGVATPPITLVRLPA